MALAGLLTAVGPLTEAPIPQGVATYPAAFFAPSQPNTAFDMLRLLPGFTLDTGTAVRGFGGAAGNVLIDGARPAVKDDALDAILQRIPASSVERIEFIRGGAGGIDMQGKTVLANIVKRQDRGAKLTVAASVTRWYDARVGRDVRVDFSQQTAQTRYEASFVAGHWLDDTVGNGTRVERAAAGVVTNAYRERNVGIPRSYKATGAVETSVLGGKARLNLSLSSSPYTLMQDDHPSSGAAPDTIDRYAQNQRIAEIGLQYDRRLSARAKIETVLLQQFGRYSQNDDFSAPGDSAQFDLRKRTSESIWRETLMFDPVASLSFKTGIEGDYNRLKDKTAYVDRGAVIAVPAANVRVSELRGEAFFTAVWRVAPTVSLESGLRFEASRIAATGDVDSRRTLSYAKPRAVLTWSPNSADQVRLRVEREIGQLNFDDFAAGQAVLANSGVHVGNPNLMPQKAWVFEGAFEHKFWRSADATVTLRHYSLRDVVDRAPIFTANGAFDAPGNIGGGSRDEVGFALTLPTDRVGLARGVLTGQTIWRWSSVTDPTTGLNRSISGLHPADAEIHFTQGLPSLKASWGFDIYDQWRETSSRFNEIDTNQKKVFVSAFIDYKPRADLSLRVELEDATARAYNYSRQIFSGPRTAASVPATDIRTLRPGRGVYLRIRKTFG